MGVRGMSKARGGGEGGDLKSMEEQETWVRLKRWARKRKVDEESGV